jgi:hypothetical protein
LFQKFSEERQVLVKAAGFCNMMPSSFTNKNISNELKLRLMNTTIDKTQTYASETWTLTKTDRKQLNIFERKVYRRILGTVYDNEKENWRILTNKETLCQC